LFGGVNIQRPPKKQHSKQLTLCVTNVSPFCAPSPRSMRRCRFVFYIMAVCPGMVLAQFLDLRPEGLKSGGSGGFPIIYVRPIPKQSGNEEQGGPNMCSRRKCLQGSFEQLKGLAQQATQFPDASEQPETAVVVCVECLGVRLGFPTIPTTEAFVARRDLVFVL
jgi:hypothetical protein